MTAGLVVGVADRRLLLTERVSTVRSVTVGLEVGVTERRPFLTGGCLVDLGKTGDDAEEIKDMSLANDTCGIMDSDG